MNNIQNILRNNFIPKCSLETIFNGADKLEFAYPMVCFCDIPLSQVKEHIAIYGHYGIGLSMEWGIENGLNLVLYLESRSDLTLNFFNMINEIIADIPENGSESLIEKPLISLICQLKRF